MYLKLQAYQALEILFLSYTAILVFQDQHVPSTVLVVVFVRHLVITALTWKIASLAYAPYMHYDYDNVTLFVTT